jgi:hypothetical protein
MQVIEIRYQNILIQGLTAMLLLLLTMFITDILELAMGGDYSRTSEIISKDPGMAGLWFLACLICINVLVQMVVRSINQKKYRWLVFAFTVCYGVFFLSHQIFHFFSGEGYGVHLVLDSTHNIVAAWTTWASYQWAVIAKYNLHANG